MMLETLSDSLFPLLLLLVTVFFFRGLSHFELFLNYLNSRHLNIKFTRELKESSLLPFLNVLITRRRGSFVISVYNKNTSTSLGLKLFRLFTCAV